jgi:thioredoxin reductase (NADPH)
VANDGRRPALVAVDDEPAVARSVQRDLRRRYGERYQVVAEESGEAALRTIDRLKLRGQPVALLMADQRMPGMSGVEYLERAIAQEPQAKRVLLTAYADTDAAIKAINDVSLDHYLLKPWDPPEERLYPLLDELLRDWEAAAAAGQGGIRVIGHRFSRRSHEIRDFLAGNQLPYRWLDIERDPEARRLLRAAGGSEDRLPVLVFEDGESLEVPEPLQVAEKVGLRTQAEHDFYDLVVVGSGPAGLAAAVYGASEGLRTVVVEGDARGGQAGQSSRIENYLGFPAGLSGADLTQRASAQAQRFGAQFVSVQKAAAIEARGPARVVRLSDGSELAAHSVLVASGVAYRRLEVPGAERLQGRGVYYGSARSAAVACVREDVFVIGAGNSAGQATLFLAEFVNRVTIVCRGASLSQSMSFYLVQRIERAPNIDVRTHAEVAEFEGDEQLEAAVIETAGTGRERVPGTSAFVFIGARPHAEWLGDLIARDERGFVLAGSDLAGIGDRWQLERDPYPLETSLPGVFVAGDVRHRSVKRVASAVGEGAMAVQLVHHYIGEL